ncbi:MAG: NAD(P)/FAD-dependent oxidoreductase [Burkholderiales bacterium]|uniref:NAD(P)/FAD-dependent oxidoreductase n=1 Tax=Ottowia pentelensis TaxID=511108 RepID=A0ABV6PSV0_9BURK|nr:FAD/NAD(P)-binding oxidoreductase [Ottowia sp.]MBN9405461.1 NAD(P)/FAD-dependent oxidoreductase [Burkholderiales bacterium]MBS0403108.1 NAD(P)/FAD-dependent oxidoreductase [Pseudomonadota bacterium]MBS0414407.1 NAD(P)/FAD-dependent oxidoreductase [Pseudomonadota bacterium]
MTDRAPSTLAQAASRRELLRALGATPLALGALQAAPTVQAQTSSAAPRIVIAGSGLGGIAVAARLRQLLPKARITIVDAKQEHNYQPGYTLVATGVWPIEKVRDRNADFQPQGVEWVPEMVAGFDPVGNSLSTVGGQKIAYDYLVVATGLQLGYDQIEGMDVKAIGSNGLGSVYLGPDAALATWRAMDAFRARGGQAVMTLPAGPLKCAGAPLKMTFMVADRLRQAGTLDQSTVDFYTGLPDDTVFGVKSVNDNVLARWKAQGIRTHYLNKLAAVDLGARKAVFATPEGERSEVAYDFLHVVPPMRAVDAVRQSELAARDGPMLGWMEVNKDTLQHKRFANVFGVGDINGTPRGKTAATVKKSAPIVAHNLARVVAGQAPDEMFDGYTSCPMIVREGSAMLIEFDYDGKLTPSLPMIEPLQESFMAWFMKVRLLKPAYLAVLKGRV